MRIAVNTRLLIKDQMDGIGNFIFESFSRIVKAHPEHDFYFLFDRPYSQEFIFADNVHPIVIGPPARHPLLYIIWFEFSVKKALKQIDADLFVSPDGMLSLSTKSTLSYGVMHDLNFEHYPKELPKAYSLYYRYFFPKFARKADRLASVSEYSRSDISKTYGIDKNNIDVVYSACRDSYQEIAKTEAQNIRQKYSEGKPYFIFVSSLQPRKNLLHLLKAFEQYRSQLKSETKLLVAGKNQWFKGKTKAFFEQMKFKDDVIFTGRISDQELEKIFASAMALFYISYFEGFGVPMLEAFNCNVPVICSDRTALPEIAGEAAMKVDPFDIGMITEAMGKVENDQELRSELIAKGIQRKNEFSWDRTADLLWNSIENLIK